MNRFHIRPYTKSVIRTEFDCGQSELNSYIRHYATQDIKRNVARIFIATPEEQDTQLAGFYTLSAGSISCSELPESLTKKLPRYPVPIAILGRLAVDLKYQGQGLGSILLADACQRVAHASKTLAVAGIVVDAKESAADFYRHFGFMPLNGISNKLLLPITYFAAG
ncbi:GNAT family N-acetyltransferase [Methylomonas sp. AM2-LC]|uniref:GNAT family N-acetyltransferase n=1 Tax=Methylomonas sp. AM2-LC TaxID=3153301 RepID=UPI0032647160